MASSAVSRSFWSDGLKRFYKAASVGKADGGYHVLLDGRPVKTPAKAALLLPLEGLAAGIAAEWDAQGEKIQPADMPLMSLATTGIDRVTPQREDVIDQIAAYGGSDLLCYRAQEPEELVSRQAEHWQPLLDWSRERFGAELAVTSGIMPLTQPDPSLAALRAAVASYDDLTLSGLYQLTTGFGSLVLALAVTEAWIEAEKAVELAQLDELFQAERWGEDREALQRRQGIAANLQHAARFIALCRV